MRYSPLAFAKHPWGLIIATSYVDLARRRAPEENVVSYRCPSSTTLSLGAGSLNPEAWLSMPRNIFCEAREMSFNRSMSFPDLLCRIRMGLRYSLLMRPNSFHIFEARGGAPHKPTNHVQLFFDTKSRCARVNLSASGIAPFPARTVTRINVLPQHLNQPIEFDVAFSRLRVGV